MTGTMRCTASTGSLTCGSSSRLAAARSLSRHASKLRTSSTSGVRRSAVSIPRWRSSLMRQRGSLRQTRLPPLRHRRRLRLRPRVACSGRPEPGEARDERRHGPRPPPRQSCLPAQERVRSAGAAYAQMQHAHSERRQSDGACAAATHAHARLREARGRVPGTRNVTLGCPSPSDHP